MSDRRISDRELSAIEERVKKATPGPWRTGVQYSFTRVWEVSNENPLRYPVGTCSGCWVHQHGHWTRVRRRLLGTRRKGGPLEHLHAWGWPQKHKCAHVMSATTAENIATKVVVGWYDIGFSWEDAEFVAHARQDVPRLLREIRRLRPEGRPLAKDSGPSGRVR